MLNDDINLKLTQNRKPFFTKRKFPISEKMVVGLKSFCPKDLGVSAKKIIGGTEIIYFVETQKDFFE